MADNFKLPFPVPAKVLSRADYIRHFQTLTFSDDEDSPMKVLRQLIQFTGSGIPHRNEAGDLELIKPSSDNIFEVTENLEFGINPLAFINSVFNPQIISGGNQDSTVQGVDGLVYKVIPANKIVTFINVPSRIALATPLNTPVMFKIIVCNQKAVGGAEKPNGIYYYTPGLTADAAVTVNPFDPHHGNEARDVLLYVYIEAAGVGADRWFRYPKAEA